MKYLMQAIERQEAKQKLPIIRMEIDYELMGLYDALQTKDNTEIIKIKERLQSLHHQLVEIEKDEA